MFQVAVIAALHYMDIKLHPESMSNLIKHVDNYYWGGLEFPLSIKGIRKFEKKNDIIVNILGVEEKKVYIIRGKKYDYRKKACNLLLIADGEQKHYTAIKSLSRLLKSSYTKHKCKQHFCMNCLQGFSTEISRDKLFKYCKDSETVKIEMPKAGTLVKFHDCQYQFIIYADLYIYIYVFILYCIILYYIILYYIILYYIILYYIILYYIIRFQSILKPIEATPGQEQSPKPNPEFSYTKVINQHIPLVSV